MELPENLIQILTEFGVGKRTPKDEFFKSNETLSEMTERISVFDIDVGKYSRNTASFKCHVPGCSNMFNCIVEYESHYNTAHKYTCCECKMILPSSHLLDLHVAETHDSFFAVQAERGIAYLCYLETCKTKFLNPTLRMQHCIDEHKFPPNFRFDYKIVQNKNIKPHSKSGSHIDDFDGTTMDTTSSGETSKKSNTTSFIQPKQFTFRPSRPKTFQENRSYTGKKFTSDKVQATTSQSTFDDENMLVELKECLPD